MLATSGQGERIALQRKIAAHVGSEMEVFTGMMKIVVTGTEFGVFYPMVDMVGIPMSNTVVIVMAAITVLLCYQRGAHLSSIAMVVAVSK